MSPNLTQTAPLPNNADITAFVIVIFRVLGQKNNEMSCIIFKTFKSVIYFVADKKITQLRMEER